jgi:hypothetical protein
MSGGSRREIQRLIIRGANAKGRFRWLTGTTRARRSTPVIRFIEARDHAPRENDGQSPDEQNDPDEQRRVDYVCTIGRTLYAFEHTGIKPFPNQIRLEDHNQKLFGPIIERFDHRADQEIWDLYVPAEASAGLTGGEVGEVQNALIKWIETNARRIPVALRYGRYANSRLGDSAGDVPFRFLCTGRPRLCATVHSAAGSSCGRLRPTVSNNDE